MRHKLVQRIVTAYKAHDDQVEAARAQRRAPGPRRRGTGGVGRPDLVAGKNANLIDVSTTRPVAPTSWPRLVQDSRGVHGAEVSVEFVGERRIRALNAEHRGSDQVTDVLSFPLEERR